ncbi:MAG: isoleucine--tRNA ligase [Patescibacteria group bacterium]|nr:isoleucine--tRNA ligase [Patescibacteria group bacterium]
MTKLEQTPSARPDFPKMEEEILEFWDKHKIFERSIEERPENKLFVFYDGPPFATGLPHHGHLLQSALKDAVPRYWTMNGYRVDRVWGWDCHGMPIENMIEKDLGLNSRREILEYGVDKFNAACRSTVLMYDKEWRKYIRRFGRWVDMDHAYKTMDDSYIESVWWAFSELYKKGLVYKDFRVSLYCPRCSTPLSNSEVTMGHSYRDEEDPAITVKFKVIGQDKTYLLAWTTTPWTLPANTAIAVNPDLAYLKIHIPEKDEYWIVAESRKAEVLKDYIREDLSDENPEAEAMHVERRLEGKEMVGWEYEPLYESSHIARPTSHVEDGDRDAGRLGRRTQDDFAKGYRVVDMPYVSAEDGTGLVHTAPAFGEDDFNASKIHKLPVLLTVDDEGKMMPETGPFAGLPIKQADPLVIADLEKRGLLVTNQKITHSVPECYRCKTLLIYKAQTAWFVSIDKLRPKMLDAAKKIHWVPESFKEGRFGNGLSSAPEWNISRTRYWGAPMPVWECESCAERKVIGSMAELKEAAGGHLTKDWDMHRPGIDLVEFKCECGGVMKRTIFTFDCWLESGSMPYASVHYPFENREKFEAHFPADFVGEAQDQTRGWFYNMHVMSSGLFGKPAAKNIVATGMILAADGKKMSKSLKNYTDPYEIMDKYGADALRMYLLSSNVMAAEAINFSDEECAQLQRSVLGILWNVRQFYLTYAEGKRIEIQKPHSMQVLDRWIFSRMQGLAKNVTEKMNGYDLAGALRPVRPFVDDLSTWWLRRSRERMKQTLDADDSYDALRTLREVLLELAKLLAPFMPFFAERLYQDLEGGKMSVHLDRWPKVDEGTIDERLESDMEWVRNVVTAGLEARVAAKLPVRQALASISVGFKASAEQARLSQRTDLLALIRDELNVEKVLLAAGDPNQPQDWMVELDTVLTPELKKKGFYREMTRNIMQLRKQSGLTPSDTVKLKIASDDAELTAWIKDLQDDLSKESKAESIEVVELTEDFEGEDMKWDGKKVKISLK